MITIKERIKALGRIVSKSVVSILLTIVYILLVPYKYLMPRVKKDVHVNRGYSIEDFKYMF